MVQEYILIHVRDGKTSDVLECFSLWLSFMKEIIPNKIFFLLNLVVDGHLIGHIL